MLALRYVYQLLHSFRSLFARHATWVTFCLIILGLLGTHHLEGVSAVCRFWQWASQTITACCFSIRRWPRHALESARVKPPGGRVAGRVVLVGEPGGG